MPLDFPGPTSLAYHSRTVASGYSRSTGTSRNTGPGTPSTAISHARSTSAASPGTVRAVAAHLVIGFISDS